MVFVSVPKQLSPQEIDEQEIAYRSLSVTEKEEAWQALDTFFQDATPVEDKNFWYTYFRWYTEFSWKRIIDMEPDFVSDMMLGRQLSVALLLDVDVLEQIMSYALFRPFVPEGLVALFKDMKKSLFESQAIVGEANGRQVLLSELVNDIEHINRKGNDSFEMVEFHKKFHELLFPNTALHKRFFLADLDTASSRFISLVHFFIGVKPEDFYLFVDSFGKENRRIPGEESTKETTLIPASAPAEEKEEDIIISETPVSQEQTRPTLKDIQAMIESRFHYGADGQFDNIEGVFALLDQLATEYNDDRIRELYYFDEETGVFQWNEEQITSNK